MAENSSIRMTENLIEKTHRQMVELIDFNKSTEEGPSGINNLDTILRTAVEESLQTLRLLTGLEIEQTTRILEVGAGYGLASICLSLMGFEVTALEPGGVGFEDNKKVSQYLISKCGVCIHHIDESAETFDFAKIHKFQLILSNNVLEHIPNVDLALDNLATALSTDGIMVHSCANYAFPFEPHYGIPLIPLAPRLTKLMLPSSIKNDGVWKSLNFITASSVKRNSRKNQLHLYFRRGTMSTSIRRLKIDVQFASRHPLLARVVQNSMVYSIAIKLLNLPVSLATPMDFMMCTQTAATSRLGSSWLNRKYS